MNTATRAYSTGMVRGARQAWSLSREAVIIALLSVCVFLTAISTVYMKDYNRRAFIQYQTAQTTQQQDNVDWSKLLLQQSRLSGQARIQRIASQKLNMVMPTSQNVTLVELPDA